MPNNDSNYILTYNHPHGQVLINELTLTNIADAIREQRLTDDTFKPALFAGEILGINEIEGGEYEGEIDLSVEEKDVNFYDYDGTRVYSYGKEEFLGLSSLPDNPSHDNLVAQGWNWNLSDAKEYVLNYGILDVGQMYNTHNESLLIDIELNNNYTSLVLNLNGISYSGSYDNVRVYWGDGSQTTDWDVTFSHTYDTGGKYTISFDLIEYRSTAGSSSASVKLFSIIGASSGFDLITGGGTNDDIYRNCIIDVRVGSSVQSLRNYAFKNCNSLRTITLHKDLQNMLSYNIFLNCYSLKSIIIPNNSTICTNGLNGETFLNCYSLKRVILPKDLGLYNNNNNDIYSNFLNCYSLKNIFLSEESNILPGGIFKECHSLKEINIPDSIISAENYIFQSCYSLKTINCYSITPPTITSTTFTGLPTYTKIYVPYKYDHSIVQAYKAATYWSDIADQIYLMPGEDNRIQPTISLSTASHYTASNINKLNITMSDNATGNIVIKDDDEDEVYNGTITNGSLTVDFTNNNNVSHSGATWYFTVYFLDNDNFKAVTSNEISMKIFGGTNTFVISGTSGGTTHTCTCTYREGMNWDDFIKSSYSSGYTLSGYITSLNNQWGFNYQSWDDPYGYTEDEIYIQHDPPEWGEWQVSGVTGNQVITHTTYTLTNYDWYDACCFEANTQILTSEGAKSIQNIDIGDTITLQNSSTGERTTTTALKVANIHYPTRKRAIVEFADGKELRYNPYHPIWTTDGYKTLGYYKDLPTLEIGDIVVLQNNTTTIVTNITIEEIPNGDLTTYNLLLAGVDDYYLEDEWGYFANDILVHHGVVNYYDEDEYRARHTNDCVNKALYENFDFDNSTDEEIISFIVELHSQSEDAYNEYMKYYLTAAQYRKFVTLYPEIKRRISEEVSS